MQLLYDIIISPLLFVYDLLFTLLYRAFQNPVSSIVALSVIVNLIVLPLYNKADAMQKEEQAKKQTMDPWVRHIRKHFRGDEQFMMLSAYYKVEHYSPLSFVKEAVPLLLQIPFFMAAYRFLSTLSVLDGAAWGPIRNLIEPDGLLRLGALTVNLLPILMTAINLISGALYARGSTLRLKLQILITALLFLVLLYQSPAGLVIYWTMNNLFSLGKNLMLQLSVRQKKTVKVAFAAFIAFLTEKLLLTKDLNLLLGELIVLGAIVYAVFQLRGEKLRIWAARRVPALSQISGSASTPILAELALAVLLGLYIPSNVLAASPREFVDVTTGIFPYQLLTTPATIYFGLCTIWLTVLFFSNGEKGRRAFAVFTSAALLFSLLNQFVFSKSFGTLYTDLKFDGAVHFPILLVILNILIGVLTLAGCVWLLARKQIWLRRGIAVIAVGLLGLSVWNLITIRGEVNDNTSSASGESTIRSYDGIFRLSKTGKNVIVFMLDRAIGSYVPYIFDEKPELKEAYQGFVLYQNTISFGPHTNVGAPALFGGYEYTPAELNARNTELLRDKHNEALLVMPRLFQEEGYSVSVCDPPFANYSDPPDLSIYDAYPDMQTWNLNGKFTRDFTNRLGVKDDYSVKQKRNFAVYSLYRTAPLLLRSFVYDRGQYIYNARRNSFSQTMISAYSVLDKLDYLTSVDDDGQNSFLLLQNETTHNPTALQPPDYRIEPSDEATPEASQSRICDGRTMKLSNNAQWGHYCINVATYQALAEWLDYLRAEGVYDNTRIILVSDHGNNLAQFSDLLITDDLDAEAFNALLMVKDCDDRDPWREDMTFMTNADVPTLATQGLIDEPINPFTGNAISNEVKDGEAMLVTTFYMWHPGDRDGCVLNASDGQWWTVHDDIFNKENWNKQNGIAGETP